MRVILTQGSCPVLQVLDVLSQRKQKTGAMLLFFQKKKNSMHVSSLHKGPCKISLRKKKNATDSM